MKSEDSITRRDPYNPLEGKRPELRIDLDPQNTDERISIIIIHKDRPEYLNIAIQTITICSINNNFELIVVDNASEDQRSQDFLDQLEKDGVKVIRNSENQWWSKAANQGAKAASKDSKYLVFLHHDVNIVHPAWLDILIGVSESSKSGCVGVNMKSYDINGERRPFVDEHCMLVTRECWQDAGPFNEELPQIGAPFLFGFKATRRGYNPRAIDQKSTRCVYHYGIFALDYNEGERFSESAKIILPKLILEEQKG